MGSALRAPAGVHYRLSPWTECMQNQCGEHCLSWRFCYSQGCDGRYPILLARHLNIPVHRMSVLQEQKTDHSVQAGHPL